MLWASQKNIQYIWCGNSRLDSSYHQVVCNTVTISTFCRHHGLGMRLPVAHAAQRDLSVTPMAVSTRNRCVLCHLLLQHVVNLAMATRTNRRLCFFTVSYLSRLVHWMARHAILCGHLDCWAVRFMAHATFGNKSMFVSMTVGTGHFRHVFAREVLYFTTFFGMTKDTGCLDLCHWDN